VDAVDAVPLRAAGPADLDRVCALLALLHAETPHAPLSPRRLRESVAGVMEGGAVLLSLAQSGEAVGTIGLAIDRPWFSDAAWVRDLWLFVDPGHRRAPHARALLRAARHYAGALRLPLEVSVTGGARGARIAAKVRLYRSELGDPSGATWMLGGS
jgi:GNAT superfamily N-acetyltransferase